MFTAAKWSLIAMLCSLLVLTVLWRGNLTPSSQSASAPSTPPELSLPSATATTAAPSLDEEVRNAAVPHLTSPPSSHNSPDLAKFFSILQQMKNNNKKVTDNDDNDGIEEEAATATATGNNASSSFEQQLLHLINPARSPLSPPAQHHRHQCPHYRLKARKDADGKVVSNTVAKYTRYVDDFCNTTGMLQMFFRLPRFLRFLDIMAQTVALQPGERILDVGSGCGTALNYYHLRYNTIGRGIDITPNAVRHAQTHARANQTFCLGDAVGGLAHLPSNSFDAVTSWAVLYHIRRTQVQCAVATEMCRVLKPGRRALIAQLRTEKTQLFWRRGKCNAALAVGNCTVRRLSDAQMFRVKAFKKHGFFSLLMEKSAGNLTAASGKGKEVDGGD